MHQVDSSPGQTSSAVPGGGLKRLCNIMARAPALTSGRCCVNPSHSVPCVGKHIHFFAFLSPSSKDVDRHLPHCHRINVCVPPGLSVEALTPRIVVFGNVKAKEVVKVK